MSIEPLSEYQPANEFFQTIFGNKPDGLLQLGWTLPDRRSMWFNNLDDIARWAVEQRDKDVYTGVAWSAVDFGPSKRCKAEDTAAINGLWGDIDVLGPAHKKSNLPPDLEAAWKLIGAMILKPTLVVNSGHGLQAWWRFIEPWVFADTDDRVAAASLSRRWADTLRARAQELGWDADSTPDLARVMRVPGTTNQKAPVAAVTVLQSDPQVCYGPVEFEPVLIDSRIRIFASATPGGTSQVVGRLRLDRDAIPPFDKWELLKSVEPRAALTFEHKRRDMKDDSASSYDYSLAQYAAMVDWDDQEICDLLIAHRRRHSIDLKLREDYYSTTIAKARQQVKDRRSQEAIEEVVLRREQYREEQGQAPPPPSDDTRKEILRNLSTRFQITVGRIVKLDGEKPLYRIETTLGSTTLDDVSILMDQRKLREKLAEATNKRFPDFSRKEWTIIVEGMLAALEIESLGFDATEEGIVRTWMYNYISDRSLVATFDEAQNRLSPFVQDGHLVIFNNDFNVWLTNRREGVSRRHAAALLRMYGAITETRTVVSQGGHRSTRQLWHLPEAFQVK